MKRRSIAPRSRDSIKRNLQAQDSDSFSLVPRNNVCLNPKLKHVRLEKARCYEEGKTVLRIWNMLDPERPTEALLDGRLNPFGSAGLLGMSMSEPVEVATYVGLTHENTPTVITDPKDDAACTYIIARDRVSTIEGVGFYEEPYVLLYNTAKRAFDTGDFGMGHAWESRWNALFSGKSKALTLFKKRSFAVCSIFENGTAFDLTRERRKVKGEMKEFKRDGVALGDREDDPLVVVDLSKSAVLNMLQLCNKEKPEVTGNMTENPSSGFMYGDPCGRFDGKTGTVKGGLFFTLFNPKIMVIDKHSTYVPGVEAREVQSYEAAVSRSFQAQGLPAVTADLNAAQVQNVLQKNVYLWRGGDDDPEDSYLLHQPTLEERCELLAKAFAKIPKLLRFCWMSRSEYLRYNSVAAILNNREVVRKTVDTQAEESDQDEDFAETSQPKSQMQLAEEEAEKVFSSAKPKSRLPSTSKAQTAKQLVDEFDAEELEPAPKTTRVSKAAQDALKSVKPPVEDEFDDEEFDDDDELNNDELDEDDLDDDEDDLDDDEFDDDDSDDDDDILTDEEGEVIEDDDDLEDSAEVLGKSLDFDDEVDSEDASVDEQMQANLAKAKAIARSANRASAKPETKVDSKAKADPKATRKKR